MIHGTMSSERVDDARIWTLTVPAMPSTGEMITWDEPAIGSIPAQSGVRGWIVPDDASGIAPMAGTVMVKVAGWGTRWTVVTITDITPHLAHDLDYGYAEVVSSEGLTGDVASHCRTCDATIHHAPIDDEADDSHEVRESPTRIRPYQHRNVYLNGALHLVGNYRSNGQVVITTVQGYSGPPPSYVQHIYRER